ncbi:VWA domain-containing protein [candidate division KSB1 bacterium]|nr:VWA domain-containing protein [candidate division KSB1 bacterium]
MKWVTVFLFFFASLELAAIDKSTFDIQLPQSLAKSGGADNHFGGKTVSNDVLSYSMLIGGYFTLGTTAGASASPFDDKCDLSFGHPYALTSFPFFSLDGMWSKLDVIADWSELIPIQDGEMLAVQTVVNDKVSILFSCEALNDGASVRLSMTVRNTDANAHAIGMGLMFDPALGQWGDGCLRFNDRFITDAEEYSNEDIPSVFELWERLQQPFGMGLSVEFTDHMPNKLIVANWPELYNDLGPHGLPAHSRALYDLCLKMLWDERELPPNGECTFQLSLDLLQPDFSSQVFLRWDMPSALSLENNILFPRHLNTTVRLMNTSAQKLHNIDIDITCPEDVTGTGGIDQMDVAAQESAYGTITISTQDHYEDIITSTALTCRSNGTILDQMTRKIYIPATPVSDHGLIVAIDSLIAQNYPGLGLVFTVEKEETGQRVLALERNNVLLYENEECIRDFSMGKFGGGSSLVDVCFVLDCSGSMGDNIAAVRNNLGEFADSLRARGFDFRVAVVTFSTTVDDVWDFTDDIELTKARLAGVNLWGGIEDSPSALYRASELSWRPGSRRTIIWITDEPYPEHNYTQEQIVNRMLALDIKVHGVGLLTLQTDWFNPILLPTGGTFYDIFGNFRDVLIDVSRMESQDHYLLTFQLTGTAPHDIRLKVHYAGLGGETHIVVNGSDAGLAKGLVCYPNPFNPVVKILVDAFDGSGDVEIFNMLGQRVRHYALAPQQPAEIVWNAHDDRGLPVSSGFYLVTLSIHGNDGRLRNETQKVLYLR